MEGVISDLAFKAAQMFGNQVGLTIVGGKSYSFAEIDDKSARCAGGLAKLGVSRGDRVVLYLPNSFEWLVAYHALARLGAVVVPANIMLAPPEVAFMASDAQATAFLMPADKGQAVLAEVGDSSAFVGLVGSPGIDSFNELLEGRPLAPVDVKQHDLFTLAYTSGTTGRPKGAMLTHGNVFASTALTAAMHERSRGETVLTALPFSHVYGNVVMNASFLVGMRLLSMMRFDPADVLSAIQQERPSLFEGVPAMYYQLLCHSQVAGTDFSSLLRCTVGGQTMSVQKIEEVVLRFGCPLLELWGMTEVSGPAASHSPSWPPRHGSIGRPFPTVEMKVVDLDLRAHDVPDGSPGELCIRGPLLMAGYWRNPEETAHALDEEGWFATGDIAIRDSDGYFEIVDRRKDLIITAGYNIYPAELERVLATHPAVSMVAVASVADAEKGELAKAFVVLRPGAKCDAKELEDHCRRFLAPYKVPRCFAFLDDLPRNSTGKILRRALRDAPSGTAAVL